MRNASKLLLLCLTAWLIIPHPVAQADEDALRVTLDKVYKEWRTALLAKSLDAWKRSTSTYRQVVSRNLIISQGQAYPDALFDLPVAPPDVFKLKLLEAEAVGPTAHLIYFGKVDLGLGVGPDQIPNNLLALKFFNENGAWKFDSSKFINLNDSPDIREACENGRPEFLKHAPFNPPGVLPAIPKPCGKPDKVAALRIEAMGYEVTAHINGFDYPTVIDNATQEVIIGGLAHGDNDLTLNLKALPVPDGEERVLNVQALMVTRDPKHPMIKVFDWKPRFHPAEPNVKLNVSLNNITMKGI
ncbi:MAG: hypothetical protein JWO94_2574 [Verrucomicrobiaceae bacterium]|nr:hypothetical protein [Verrucomicrobiaceae bacterium]